MKVKLNFKKIEDMMLQLKTDESIIKTIKNDKVLYLGVIGEEPNYDTRIRINPVNFNCILFLVGDSKFFGRNVLMFYDWELIKRVSNIENEISNIKTRTSNIETRITNIETRITNIETIITNIETRITNIETELSSIKGEFSDLKKLLSAKKAKNERKKIAFLKNKRKRAKIDTNDFSDSK